MKLGDKKLNKPLNLKTLTGGRKESKHSKCSNKNHVHRTHNDDSCAQKNAVSNNPKQGYIVRINSIRDTVWSLEESLMLSRNSEAEQWLRYSILKTRNRVIIDDLRKANKRNKSMLNLFRQSVTDVRLGNEMVLPESLKREVQRTWHQKYDTLLMKNEKLRKDILAGDSVIKEKTKQIDDLEQKVLNLAERIVERNEAVQNMCAKYLDLKKRKDEQEALLRGSIETLQDALQRANNVTTKRSPGMALAPSKDALLTREIRRSDRLAHENALLRGLLQEARRGYKTSRSTSTVSFDKLA